MNKNIFLTLLLVAMISNSNSKELMVGLLPSTEWQKVQLEKEVDQKLRSVLSPILNNTQLVIDIKIDTSEPTRPSFRKRKKNTQDESLKSEVKDEIKRIRINDNLPKELPKDYIIFSKLGLEAPLIEDTLKAEFEKNLQRVKDASEKPSAEEQERSLPALEQAWNYNSSLDIFKNLEEIKIILKIDESKKLVHEQEISTLIKELNLSYGEISPEITITYLQLKKEQLPKGIEAYTKLILKFANSIGLIIAALILCFFSILIFYRYVKLKREEMENAKEIGAMSAPQGEGSENKETDKDQDESINSGLHDNQNTDNELTEFLGIKRFNNYLKRSPEMASLIVKKWIKSEHSSEQSALKALVQQLENQDLEKIFSNLTIKQRNSWRDKLSAPLSRPEITQANQFISNQVVEDIIVPNVVDDTETQELLLSITPEVGCKILEERSEFGKVLMHLLQGNTLNSIFNISPPEIVEIIINDSLSFNKEEIPSFLAELKVMIKKFSINENDDEFVNKVIDLLPNASKMQESVLFTSISKAIPQERLSSVAFKNYPSELMMSLPGDCLKTLISKYPMKEKVKLLLSLSEEMLTQILEIIAPVGSKAKDLYDLELEKERANVELIKSIKIETDLIWKSYMLHVRGFILSNNQFENEIKETIEDWSAAFYKSAIQEVA